MQARACIVKAYARPGPHAIEAPWPLARRTRTRRRCPSSAPVRAGRPAGKGCRPRRGRRSSAGPPGLAGGRRRGPDRAEGSLMAPITLQSMATGDDWSGDAGWFVRAMFLRVMATRPSPRSGAAPRHGHATETGGSRADRAAWRPAGVPRARRVGQRRHGSLGPDRERRNGRRTVLLTASFEFLSNNSRLKWERASGHGTSPSPSRGWSERRLLVTRVGCEVTSR